MELNSSVVHIQSAEGVCECLDLYENKKQISGVEIVRYDLIKEKYKDKFIGFCCDNEGIEIGKTYIYIDEIGCYISNCSNIELEAYRHQCSVIMDFIRLLGAKEFRYEVEIIEGNKKSLMNKLKGRCGFLKGEAEINKAMVDEIKTKLNLYALFQKNEDRSLSAAEFSKAQELYDSNSILKSNPECKSILNARDPSENNQGKSYTLTFTLSKNLQSSINIAASLSKLKVASIKNEFCQKTEVNKSVKFSFTIDF